MTFKNLMTDTVMIARLEELTKNHFVYATVTAEANVSIQRLSEEKALQVGGAVGKTFRLYCGEDVNIMVDDKLVDESGDEYKVTAVTVPAQLGNFIHKECIIIRIKP